MTPDEPPSARTPEPPTSLGWMACYRIAARVYDEFSFQSIYALKQGNTAVMLEGRDEKEIVPKARTRVAQSKGMVAFLLFMVISAGAVALHGGPQALYLTITPEDYTTSVLAGELLMIFSLLWMTGLQVAPTLLGSRVFPLLATMPLTRRDMERVGLITFVRIFDAPALTAVAYLPFAVGLVTASQYGAATGLAAGLILLPGAIITVVLASAISLVTARFFLIRVSGARGGTRGSIAVRWLYLLLWSLPSLAITAFVAFSIQILNILSAWELANPGAFRTLLLLYPFPFAYLTAIGIYPMDDIYHLVASPVLWGVILAYAALALLSANWLRSAPVEMALLNPRSSRGESPRGSEVKTRSPVLAILSKDMRIASRTPGYAFLILLPLMDAFILGVSTFVQAPSPQSVVNYAIAAVTVAALLATFFGPAFFATEVMGFSFTRTLPIPRRTLLFGKASLILLIYLAAAFLVMVLVALRIGDPYPFAIFAAAELPGVLAAAFLELGVLFHRAERTGIPVTNLYSGAWWATLVVLPGLMVAGFPLIVWYLGQTYDKALAVPYMVLVAMLLFAVTSSWAIWGSRNASAA